MSKRLPCRFKHFFGPFKLLSVEKCSDLGLLRHLSNTAFCSLEFQKQISFEDHHFLQSIPDFMYISEMQQKIEKIFSDFEIIAFQLVSLNSRF